MRSEVVRAALEKYRWRGLEAEDRLKGGWINFRQAVAEIEKAAEDLRTEVGVEFFRELMAGKEKTSGIA